MQGFLFILPFILKLFLTIVSWMHPLLRQPLSFLLDDFRQLMITAENNLLGLAEYLFQVYHFFCIHKLVLFCKELTLLYSLCRKVKLFHYGRILQASSREPYKSNNKILLRI